MAGERTGVRLEPVTQENVRAVCDLRVAPAQESFVTPNAVSLAEAYVYPEAWCRAVYAGDDLAHRGEGGPGPFYESLGFRPTGEIIDGEEDVYALPL
jgi:hypothetical protein